MKILLLVIFVSVVLSFPIDESSEEISDEVEEESVDMPIVESVDDTDDDEQENAEYGEFFQGDIDIGLADRRYFDFQKEIGAIDSKRIYVRPLTGLTSSSSRWPKNTKGYPVVPYVISEDYSSDRVIKIRKGMKEIERFTCIRFKKYGYEEDYISIEPGKGCHSKLGREGGGQVVSLGSGCFKHGTIMHELIHALGYTHMHNHEDRDKYVTINFKNILSKHVNNFKKTNSSLFSNFGTPYDFTSVMHYNTKGFSKNGEPTIELKQRGYTKIVGQRETLSAGDITRINNMYECNSKLIKEIKDDTEFLRRLVA